VVITAAEKKNIEACQVCWTSWCTKWPQVVQDACQFLTQDFVTPNYNRAQRDKEKIYFDFKFADADINAALGIEDPGSFWAPRQKRGEEIGDVVRIRVDPKSQEATLLIKKGEAWVKKTSKSGAQVDDQVKWRRPNQLAFSINGRSYVYDHDKCLVQKDPGAPAQHK
jgi:hypothetical protein